MKIKNNPTIVNEKAAYRYSENMLSPVQYNVTFPKKELMKRLKELIKNTNMTSANERFANPTVETAVDKALKELSVQRSDHWETIACIAKDDGLKKIEMGKRIQEITEFIETVHVK